MTEMTEVQIERYLARRVEELGGLCVKMGVDGWPDRVCVWRGGRVSFVELKRQGGTVSERQKIRIAELRKRGADVEVLASVEAVDKFMASRGGGGRGIRALV